jgi:hypothetical protein
MHLYWVIREPGELHYVTLSSKISIRIDESFQVSVFVLIRSLASPVIVIDYRTCIFDSAPQCLHAPVKYLTFAQIFFQWSGSNLVA